MDGITIEYTPIDDNTVLATSTADIQDAEAIATEILRSAFEQHRNNINGMSSVIPTDNTTTQALTLDSIDAFANGLNSSIENLRTVNAIILRKVLEDGYLGIAYQSVVTNVNTDYKLFYPAYEDDDTYADALAEVKNIITQFNKDIGLKRLIREVVSGTYLEGNYPLYMRLDKNKKACIDHYPLTICYPSDYLSEGRNVLEFNLTSLKAQLQKTYQKTRRNKAVYFENMLKEVQANYPKEIIKGYTDNERLLRLDPKYSACVKFGDMGRKLGVSPLFRALRPLVILDQIEAADVSDSKARSKKIIFQKLRKEVLGPDGTRKGLDLALYAHQQAAAAIKTNFGLYTAAPFVEDLSYVQAKAQSEDAINQQKLYTQKMLISLGIGFTDIDSTVGAGKISVAQLMKMVNAICESFEDILHHFYETLLEENGMDPEMAPHIRVIDAEQMEMQVRRDLAQFVFSTLNCSLGTAMEIIGLDVKEEKEKREKENDDGYDDIFYPHQSSYTSSGNRVGRPRTNWDTDKQEYDQVRNT